MISLLCCKLIFAHVIGVLFSVKSKDEGENVIVAVVRTAIVEDTLGRYPLPKA